MPARVSFDWLPGKRFLIQRWQVPIPEAPDGIAISGVARVYTMSFSKGIWRLWREEPDFSPLDFRQRFTGTFSDNGTTITAKWEKSSDGSQWEHDFDLTYTRATEASKPRK
jgi:hypothetical protein